ncbi:glycosyl hydrolase family 28-related protein [Salipiger sp. 1_MG-2023]|uniref:glycosyl hydrolase family 28-related protein n=1 Tax=Salipiger sp. 1_MG-2023 TaxID=3062665 RepID=UPI0026E3064F|nr:glycosyl hydrolase family 28-related protein [Salipiger sp. 1_MG-2023]MDO6586981.1 glycosyl hydrolase family 28-related protein [Salipiger sp. 1_MG-2023]
MALVIPSLPMTGSRLKTTLEEIRQRMPIKLASTSEMSALSGFVDGDRCLTPQGVYEIFSGVSAAPSATVVSMTQDGMLAMLAADCPVPDVDTLMSDTRPPEFFTAGMRLMTQAETYVYRVAASDASDHHVTTAGGAKLYVEPGPRGFDVRAFGAQGDSVTDDSAAIRTAFRAAVSSKQAPTIGSNEIVQHAVFLPGGQYLVNSPRSLMDTLGVGRAMGLTYEGDATGTTIHFGHDGEDYLCYNPNEFLFVRFRNLRFTASSDTARFMFVNASGGAQDVLFENCNWNGTWQKLYRLEGGNNNSEWRWSNCAITATIRDTVLDIPSEGSDQFLNYWATNCKFWLYDGQFLRARKGGHFHFVNCDWSGLAPGMTQNQSTRGAPLFELLGDDHARGVCSFTVTGGRVEHKNAASKLIYCEWNYGTVAFRDLDCGAVTPSGYDTVINTHFSCGNTQGPTVLFEGCDLIGTHVYSNGTGAYVYEHNAAYRMCTIRQNSPDDFLTFNRTTNVGGSWLVELDRCRSATPSSSTSLVVWDVVLGSRLAKNGHFGKRSFVFRDVTGRGTPLTTGTFTAQLPARAVITRVAFRNSGLLSSINTVNFRLEDGAGTLIAQSGDHSLNSELNIDLPVSFLVPLGNETLVLRDANGVANQQGTSIFVEVEFIV